MINRLDTNSIISSGLLESYVLGNCTVEEKLLVEELCVKHPEVLAEIEAIEDALMQYASISAPELSGDVKSKLMLKLNNKAEPVTEHVSGKVAFTPKWYGYAAAAAVVLLIVSSAINLMLYSKVKKLSSDLTLIQQEKDYYVDQFNVQNASLNAKNNEIAVLSDPNTKLIELKSTSKTSDAKAVIYWNSNSRQTYLSYVSLPTPPQGKQYQLWAIVDGNPVDAGVFDSTATLAQLQKMKEIVKAQAFAVTLENVGGSPTPTLTTLCLLGNV